jgi:subtilisin family serine protease
VRTSRIAATLVALALVLSYLPQADAQAQRPRPRHVAGELIIKYKAGVDDSGRVRARARAGAKLKRSHRASRGATDESHLDVVTLPAGVAPFDAIAALEADPAIEYAEPNGIHTHFATPNDPRLGQLWALNNTGQLVAGQTRGAPDADIDALEAWASTTGSPQVYIAVLDEGIDIGHEDLGADPSGPIWTNPYEVRDGIDNDGNGYVDDLHGFDFAANDNSLYDGHAGDLSIDAHGTHVAGTIGARVNNGVGVAGLNWDVRIIPAKFLTPAGGTTDAAVRGIDYIVDLKRRHGLNIVAINASWGGGGFSQALLEAIARAGRADILFIAAAGNGGDDKLGDDNDRAPEYPASYDTTALAGYDSVISVAATGLSDELTAFSNYGSSHVDLAAPGAYILSTTPQNGYRYFNGTSMATPHVTGAAALISAATGLTARDLRTRMLAAIDPVSSLQGRMATGGRLNVRAALGSLGTSAPSAVLPDPWRSQDIGAVGAVGRATAGDADGTFTVSGAGADVWGTADAFQFAYRTLSGDGTIVARVASVQNVAAWTKAGVMIRSSLSAGSAHAFLLVSPGKGVAFQRRASNGGQSASTSGSLTTAPRWLRITRTGGSITAAESADGASWRTVGSSSIALGTTAYVGLAVSSHVAGRLADAGFESVAVVSPAAPANWTNQDIGPVGRVGSATATNGIYTVRGSGADIWGTADQLQYMFQPLTGDGTMVARVTAVQNTHVWVKAGVMIRATLAASSPQALMLVTPGGTKGLAFQRRVSAGGISRSTSGGGGSAPAWVKLVRAGSTISAYRSSDGVTWTFVGSDTFAMGTTVYAGVAVSSHDNAVLAAATFDQLQLIPR